MVARDQWIEEAPVAKIGDALIVEATLPIGRSRRRGILRNLRFGPAREG
jgi:hypothetical protein